MKYHQPMVFKLIASVGQCGTNDPKDVEKIQTALIDAGYNVATGRNLAANGRCSVDTIEAIRWYQVLLSMSPSGLIQPVDTWFLKAISGAGNTLRNPHKAGTLTVREGQFTFDNEGVDYITAIDPFRQPLRMPYFSRVLHWPGGVSGVTLGRGYDMGSRSVGSILSTLRQAGLEEYKSVLCSKAAGFKGRQAFHFVQAYGQFVGEITHQQQVNLFEIIYPEYVKRSQHYYNKYLSYSSHKTSWDSLDIKIREVFVDIVYQGVDDIKLLVKAASSNNKENMVNLILNSHLYIKYEKNRNRVRFLR
ncbi:lysozyme family protein [Mangrovibacter yixingensis]|uniref:peptidoglycan-binding protein n=1 Tax=Mangrovibacter yixingensis TaxID=1529639 RepID=UPI001CFB6F67|nr:peptidoglycan-binding protein [Mangrovibacter yixingensis]